MAVNKLIFKDSEAAKNAIMATQKKEIAALYENWADEIGERAKYYSHKSTASSVVSERQMKELQKMLKTTSQEVSNEVYSKIKKNIYTISDAVVADNVKWLKSFGFSEQGLNAAFNYVPDEIVRNLITGQIYDSGWSLSQRIWSDNEQTLKDIYRVVAKGISENKPIYEIAKELEAYVRPEARLPWNLRAPDGVKIYKKQVDYNAQRLARTLVQHGYQQSFLATTQHNPFILEYIWRSNGSRVCKLCLSRDGVHYKKDELPMDHPNGMCTMIPNVADDMIDQLADWVNSPDGTFPEIDKFAKNFGYVPNVKSKIDKPIILSGKKFDDFVRENNAKVIYRGYSAPSQEELDARFESLSQGTARVSSDKSSALGKGVYFADSKDEANSYMSRRMGEGGDKFGRVDEVALKVGAKVIDYDELHKIKLEEISKMTEEISDIRDKFGTKSKEYRKAKDEYYDFKDMEDDEFARYMSYDAIYHKATGYTVVINQKAIVIKK